ncbi:YheV family putative zinc ribbon protein [Veronia pacifica]|uniref:Metal-binding protein n=1 Tax=Veronia pacifica TaxID=1080227 RepID=A0A1C3EAC1_9GAMM|nr:YheV family putative zinc ribbon protein [Veronia pacifica]ODA30159.1 metal-binding protein [Veronia pacifica]
MKRKRFIAGATCPECKETDTLRWWVDHHIEVVECVRCGHMDRRSPNQSPQPEVVAQSADVIGIFKPE